MTHNTINIRFVSHDDYKNWLLLWEQYLAFYNTELSMDVAEKTWERFLDDNSSIFCLIAEKDHKIIGLAHYLYHPSTWSIQDYCYLSDLFVLPEYRGMQIGKALIESLTAQAEQHGCAKVYWHTQETNHTAQRLYDWIAVKPGMIKYDIVLS